MLAAALVVGLRAATAIRRRSGDPTFYRSMAAAGAQVDAAAAASMISGYRKNNGLGAVTVDPALMKLAAEQAHAMASRDKLDHDVGGAASTSGSRARATTPRRPYENIGAGYHTLAEAFSGWRGSPATAPTCSGAT